MSEAGLRERGLDPDPDGILGGDQVPVPGAHLLLDLPLDEPALEGAEVFDHLRGRLFIEHLSPLKRIFFWTFLLMSLRLRGLRCSMNSRPRR